MSKPKTERETVLKCIQIAQRTQQRHMTFDYDTGGDIIEALKRYIIKLELPGALKPKPKRRAA